ATLVVPRRDGGPIISLNPATGAALSVQYVGFGPTQELDAFLLINRSRNLDDFKDALQRMDVAQNFVYVDVGGNIAYFTSGEIPVREDLQAGTVNGVRSEGTRLNSSHVAISYAVFCLKKKKNNENDSSTY